MSAASYNMNIDQGSDFLLTLTIKDPAGLEVDLTGFTFSGQIRKNISDSTVVASFDFTILDQVTNTGQVTVGLDAATSSAILLKSQKTVSRKAEKMAYDIEKTDTLGQVERILQGQVLFSPEVTR